jgi:predicted kinase
VSATLFVLVGLPGAGKTTRARELEARHGALRLTPDEWMIPLFGEPEADGGRDVLEGRFVWLALRALRLGVDVVLDFGVWSRDERSALRAIWAGGNVQHRVFFADRPTARAAGYRPCGSCRRTENGAWTAART